MKDDNFYHLDNQVNEFLNYINSFSSEEIEQIYYLILLENVNMSQPFYGYASNSNQNWLKYYSELDWANIRKQISKNKWIKDFMTNKHLWHIQHYNKMYDYIIRCIEEIYFEPINLVFLPVFGFNVKKFTSTS